MEEVASLVQELLQRFTPFCIRIYDVSSLLPNTSFPSLKTLSNSDVRGHYVSKTIVFKSGFHRRVVLSQRRFVLTVKKSGNVLTLVYRTRIKFPVSDIVFFFYIEWTICIFSNFAFRQNWHAIKHLSWEFSLQMLQKGSVLLKTFEIHCKQIKTSHKSSENFSL